MARLTIEECWWSDPRREKLGRLLGNIALADAASIRAWRLAQEFWGHGYRLIPVSTFNALESADQLIESGLARREEGFVYICGSSQYLSWLQEKRKSASAAGKKSAERPRDKKGRLLGPESGSKSASEIESEEVEEYPTMIQRVSNTPPTESNIVQRSYSSSSSFSEKEEEYICTEQTGSLFSVPMEAPSQSKLEITAKVKPSMFEAWCVTYGSEFVTEEIKQAQLWCMANSKKAPKANPTRFLNGWLSRSWERRRKTIPSTTVEKQPKPVMDF